MIWDKRPSEAVGTCFNKKAAETIKEPTAVIIIQKDIGAFDTTNDDVLQKAWNVEAGLSWHGRKSNRKMG